jgi:basic membrane protein A
MGGMAVPAVVRFGYGFVQGAEYAAKELNLPAGSVSINYYYTGGFAATPEIQTMSASWYNQGVEVIFAAGGAVAFSVFAAAEQTGKKVIGVDVDQSGESPTVITSAMKGIQASVYDSIVEYYSGRFPGGQTKIFEAANKGVGLPMATSKFQNFKQADYDAIFNALATGRIPRMMDDPNAGGSPSVVPVTITRVNEIR